MKSVRFLLILFVFNPYCYGQGQHTDSLINKFRNRIETIQKDHDRTVIMNDETRVLYYSLMINSSVKDLIRYTNDSNAFVRTYVFSGLLRKKVNKDVLLKILDAHKNDTAIFTSMSADIVTSWTVKEYMQTGMRLRSANKLPHIDYRKSIENIRNTAKNKIEISGIHEGLIEKEELLKIDTLVLTVDKFKIISFVLITPQKSFKSSGNAITNEMKSAINELAPGDILIFEDIDVLVPDNTMRRLQSIGVKLK